MSDDHPTTLPDANGSVPFEMTMTLPLPCGCPMTFNAATMLPAFLSGPMVMPHPPTLHDIAMACAHTLVFRYGEGAAGINPFTPCPNGTPGHDDLNLAEGEYAPPDQTPEPNAPSTTTKQ